jgi:hypothetical protein
MRTRLLFPSLAAAAALTLGAGLASPSPAAAMPFHPSPVVPALAAEAAPELLPVRWGYYGRPYYRPYYRPYAYYAPRYYYPHHHHHWRRW